MVVHVETLQLLYSDSIITQVTVTNAVMHAEALDGWTVKSLPDGHSESDLRRMLWRSRSLQPGPLSTLLSLLAPGAEERVLDAFFGLQARNGGVTVV